MVPSYARPLKVSNPEGERIYAKVFRSGDNVRIEINYLEVVKKDDPSFAHNGVITFNVPKEKYSETIKILTQYLEDLFLKGMADESIYTSLGAKSKLRRTKKSGSAKKVGISERVGSTSSVHVGPRGDESPESSRRRKSESEMAESGDSENSGKD